MQNHDESHAAVCGHVIEEFMKRIEAAGRGAYANDRKPLSLLELSVRTVEFAPPPF